MTKYLSALVVPEPLGALAEQQTEGALSSAVDAATMSQERGRERENASVER